MAGLDTQKSKQWFHTHGEGFGLPLYEGSSAGLPVIATDWSGHLDFLSMKENLNSKGKIRGGKTRGKIATAKKMFAAVKYIETIPGKFSMVFYILSQSGLLLMIKTLENERCIQELWKMGKESQETIRKLSQQSVLV